MKVQKRTRKIIQQVTICRDLAETFGLPAEQTNRMAILIFLSKSFPERILTKRTGVWYDAREYRKWKRVIAEGLST